MTSFFLYLFLAGQCPIQVPGPGYDSYDECDKAGQVEIVRWGLVHRHSPAFAWCVKGGSNEPRVQ